MSAVSVEEARTILGADVLSPDDATAALGKLAGAAPSAIPFDRETLAQAARNGEMLVFRAPALASGISITIAHFIEAFPEAFDPKFLAKVGYQLKDEWGITLEPLTSTEVCRAGWALVRKEVVAAAKNLSYAEQEPVLREYSQAAAASYRRRNAVEVVYDTILYWKARDTRLLAQSWDWTASRTVDGGYLNVGGFGDPGIQLFSYSRAVRHGALSLCPTRP